MKVLISNVYIFRRIEKKYVISEEQYLALLGIIGERLIGDAHGRSTVNSLYLGTPDYRLIRASIETKNGGSVYKEKLRVRSYGISSDDSGVFFEIKKKYAGVVYKRRVLMKLSECMEYIACGKKPFESQIMNEIDYAMTFYGNPTPRTLLSYEREAYLAREAPDLRITFDRAVRYRSDGPAVYIKCADKVFMTLAENTENLISDGSSYEISDGDTTLDAALCGKDCVKIGGGNITLTAGSDGSSLGGRPGQGSFTSSNGSIVISGESTLKTIEMISLVYSSSGSGVMGR